MRLIDVDGFLTRERNIQKRETVDCNIKPVLTEHDDTVTDYAILSHRWVADEVGYTEIVELAKMDGRDEIRGRAGYQKILKSCEQAKNDGLKWLWVDTCCIDKRSSSELSEALNSMFRWYENSKRCYAYLHDVDVFPTSPDTERFAGSQGWPEWFSRGWTLQELIAPRDLQFFNTDWQSIGDKRNLASMLEIITRIPSQVLQDGLVSYGPSIAQVMSWAAERRTTRIEDRAYSLMGLLDVNMPTLYGEGKKAFLRLQLEVLHKSNDQTLFAWNPTRVSCQTAGTTGRVKRILLEIVRPVGRWCEEGYPTHIEERLFSFELLDTLGLDHRNASIPRIYHHQCRNPGEPSP
ncbi:heterokaryon incompatibility protein-domain-containing protein [Pisolithus marmoratus]|nr:heterokaryon incompatibility protein-domain-containing protein [Pisolithus marmoratus]